MSKNKHLSFEERTIIKSMLDQGCSFKSIARTLGRNCTTISKEVRNHLTFKKSGCFGRSFNDCANRFSCPVSHLCSDPDCRFKKCSLCSKCQLYCNDYFKQCCPLLSRPPYVCNACKARHKCTLEKHLYSASFAQQEYEQVRSESRSGICLSEEEAVQLDNFISPLIRKGQSIHHICVSNPSEIMFSEKTIYNYVDSGIFSAKNIDLPRKVSYRPRKSPHDSFKVDRSCRIGRTYSDPLSIEMDAENTLRTRMFYCDPSAPFQKGAAENNHEFIRRVLPKGTSFDDLFQEDIDLMMNHINSYTRANLGDHSPYEMFRMFYGQEILDLLGAVLIPANEITLRPELLKK